MVVILRVRMRVVWDDIRVIIVKVTMCEVIGEVEIGLVLLRLFGCFIDFCFSGECLFFLF